MAYRVVENLIRRIKESGISLKELSLNSGINEKTLKNLLANKTEWTFTEFDTISGAVTELTDTGNRVFTNRQIGIGNKYFQIIIIDSNDSEAIKVLKKAMHI